MKYSKYILIIPVIFLVGGFYLFRKDTNFPQVNTQLTPTPVPQNSTYATVVSTNPPDLQNTIILPNQTIQIVFSDPVLNTDELKHKMDPEGGYKLKLSDDRKTLSIIPDPAFQIGTGYTFSILSNDSKFDNGKKLQSDIIYHFQTIQYRGV